MIRLLQDFLHNKGLYLYLEKAKINNPCENFTFKGAIYKRVATSSVAFCSASPIPINNDISSPSGLIRRDSIMHMDIDLLEIYKIMVESKYARFSNNNPRIPLGTANNSFINLSHGDIVELYNFQIFRLTNLYLFAANRHKLLYIIRLLHRSCVLTLAKKYKTKSMRAILKKYGKSLACPNTGVKFLNTKSLKAINEYDPFSGKGANKNLLTWEQGFRSRAYLSSLLVKQNRINFGLGSISSVATQNSYYQRGFSTKVNANLNYEEIPPYFITGFVDGEGCFRLKLSKNSKYTIG